MSAIELRRRDGSTRARVLVDAADVQWLSQWPWCLGANRGGEGGYAQRRSKGCIVYMHRLIAGANPGFEVDHINGDTLDNRRLNLRVVTRAANQQNRAAVTGRGTSRFRGVCFDRDRGLWLAQATVNYRSHHIGRFATEEEAAQAVAVFRAERMPFSAREAEPTACLANATVGSDEIGG